MIIEKLIAFQMGIAILFAGTVAAQADSTRVLAGDWKGTSICQQKNSACNDEQVVMHISPTRNNHEYSVVMNKIVNGAEVEMGGSLLFSFDPMTRELMSTPSPDRIWRFKLLEQKLDGTFYYKGVLFRVISVKKSGWQ